MNDILLMGGGGYIGSALAKKFLQKGYKITIVDNLLYKQGHLISDILLHKNCKFINADLVSVPDQIRQSKVIYWLAAYVGPICDRYPEETQRVNIDAVKWALSLLKDQKFYFCCSSSGYGDNGGMCDENMPMSSLSLYARSKEEAEKEVLKYSNACSFRLATVWGPSNRHRFDLLVNDLTWQALKYKKLSLFQGDYLRAYVHINDVVDILGAVYHNQNMVGHIFNVAGDNCSKSELVNKIKNYISSLEVSYEDRQDSDKRNYYLDCSKLEKFGFKTQYTIDSSLKTLLDYYSILDENDYRNPVMRNI